jgi:hypothetical protein
LSYFAHQIQKKDIIKKTPINSSFMALIGKQKSELGVESWAAYFSAVG